MDQVKGVVQGVLAFLQTVRSGSFTKAAEQMGVTPQSISHSIARLESQLSVRLFNRTTRSLVLTEEGLRFRDQAQAAIDALELAVDSVSTDVLPTGTVRVSTSVGFGRKYLIPELPGFKKLFPQVQVELVFDDRRVDLIADGFDVVVRGGLISDSSVVSRRLCNLSSVLVASPKYLKRKGIIRRPQDLVNHDVIQLKFLSGLTPSWDFKVGQSVSQFEPKGSICLSDPESVGDAASLGLGVASISVHHAWHWLRSGELKIVLFNQYISPPREVVMQYPHRSGVAPRVKVFVEHMVRAMQAHPELNFKRDELLKFV